MGHRYCRNPDHIRNRHVPAPENEAIDQHLQQLLSPLIYNQQSYYRSLGLRDRILTLLLMVAAIVTLLWRQVPSVQELGNFPQREYQLSWANEDIRLRQQWMSF